MPSDDPDSKPALRAIVSDGRGRPVACGEALAEWLAGHVPRSARGEVGIALVSDAQMRTLNRTYRRTDYATDVLSFPAEPPTLGGKALVAPDGSAPEPCLGDLVIATGVAKRQAREAGHSLETEFKVLALHGLLHLLGYDHERDEGQMARLERRLLRKAGLTGGLIGRESAR